MSKLQETVLVVDDTEVTRYLISCALKNAGYIVVEAATGVDALEKAKLFPDLITLDIQLPDMSGLEVCKRLKGDPETSGIPVLHISANFVHGSQQAYALESGADAYLTHPIQAIVLTATVRALLRARKAETELREAHKKLEQHILELNEQRELREKFVSTLSHDLRNPLSAIMTTAQVILRPTCTMVAAQKQATRIVSNADRMDKMIQNLLDANRIRAGRRLPIQVGECDVDAVARDAAETLAAGYGERFVVESAGSLVGHWSADHLQRALENLAGNAIKYGKADALITIRVVEREGSLVLSVHNEGNPLSVEEQADLFQMHKRIKATSAAKIGWGLGLTVVRGVAEAHGGSVAVTSSVTSGTTFTITLPMDARPFQEAV